VHVCAEHLGEPCERGIKDIPVSNGTMNRRVRKLSDDVTGQFISKTVSCIWFAIQMDESAYIHTSYHAILLV
jgi:hypothetical protein